MEVDLNELREDLGDEQAVVVIVQSFLEGARLLLAELRPELVRREYVEIRRLAHGIKGGAMNIGAHDLQHASQALELAALEQRGEDLEPLYEDVLKQFGLVEAFLQKCEGIS